MLATNGVASLRTAKVDLKIDGISHTMLVFVIDKGRLMCYWIWIILLLNVGLQEDPYLMSGTSSLT